MVVDVDKWHMQKKCGFLDVFRMLVVHVAGNVLFCHDKPADRFILT